MKPEDLEVMEVKVESEMYKGTVVYTVCKLKVEGGFIYYFGNHRAVFVPYKAVEDV